MADIATLGIRVDTSQVKSGARDLDSLAKSGANAERSTMGLSDSFASLRATIAAAGIAVALKQYTQLGDRFSTMQSRLRLVTDSSEQLADVQHRLVDLANRQRAPLEATVALYASSANAAGELGASQEQLLKFTEGVSAALTINGSTAQSAAGALFQLGQAVGGNIIQAQEYNALIDGARPLLQAVANNLDGAAGSVNKLTTMVKNGEVSSRAFFQAAVKGSDELIAKMEKIPPTVGQAFTVMGNNILYYTGLVDNAAGATGGLAQAIIDFANSPALRVPFETLGVLGINLVYVFKQVVNEIGGIGAQIAALLAGDFKRFSIIGQMMKEDAKAARAEVDRMSAQILNRSPLALSSGGSSGGGGGSSGGGGGGGRGRSSAMSADNQAAQDLANAYQDLMTAASDLNRQQMTQAQSVQELLDSFGRIDPKVREFVQTQINLANATELATTMAENQARAEEDALAEMEEQSRRTADAIEEFKNRSYEAWVSLQPEAEQLAMDISEVRRQAEALGLSQDFADPIVEAMEKAALAAKDTSDEMSEFVRKAAENMQDAMSNFFFDAMQGDLDNLGDSFKRTIDRMVADLLASQLLNFLMGDFAKSGQVGGFLGDIFGGFFADGGSPPLNKVSVVGENGPELFVPKSSGTVIPNNQVQGGNVVVNMTINGVTDANSFNRSKPQIMAEMQRSLNRGRRIT